MSSFALILFDSDGCTAVVQTKELTVGEHKKGSYMQFRMQRKNYKVEILELSDSKDFLNDFENEWSSSARSIALDKEKEKREGETGGFLDVWPQDEPLPPADHAANNTQQVLPPNNTGTKTGSNGRIITVHHDGDKSFAPASENATPQRKPGHFDSLSQDEIDLINSAITDAEAGRQYAGTQTVKVVIFGSDENPIQMLKNPAEQHHKSSQTPSTKSSTKILQTLATSMEDKGTRTEECKNCTNLEEKVNKILHILLGLQSSCEIQSSV